MKDKQGGSYATVRGTKPGMKVEVDGGFTCIEKGAVREVKTDAEGHMFFDCTAGQRYLAGQYDGEDDDTAVCLGLCPVGEP